MTKRTAGSEGGQEKSKARSLELVEQLREQLKARLRVAGAGDWRFTSFPIKRSVLLPARFLPPVPLLKQRDDSVQPVCHFPCWPVTYAV